MKPHEVKCGCYSCTEYRRDNARLRKYQHRWAERDVQEALAPANEAGQSDDPNRR